MVLVAGTSKCRLQHWDLVGNDTDAVTRNLTEILERLEMARYADREPDLLVNATDWGTSTSRTVRTPRLPPLRSTLGVKCVKSRYTWPHLIAQIHSGASSGG